MFILLLIRQNVRNWMEYQYFNDCLVVYIENDAVDIIDNETIIHQFQNMKTHKIKF